MSRLLTLTVFLGLIVLPAVAGAQQSSETQQPADTEQRSEAQSSPGVWFDIMRTPAAQGTYGAGQTSTMRMLNRCAAFLWSIAERGNNAEVPKYRRDYQSGYCLGWINSELAALNIRDDAGKQILGVCVPDELDSRDVAAFLINYANEHKDRVIYNPTLLIYWALKEKYPCPK